MRAPASQYTSHLDLVCRRLSPGGGVMREPAWDWHTAFASCCSGSSQIRALLASVELLNWH